MTTRTPTWCDYCIHLKANTSLCSAFPDGIPDMLLYATPHLSPVGDETDTFALDPKRKDEFLDMMPYLPQPSAIGDSSDFEILKAAPVAGVMASDLEIIQE